MLEQPAAGSGHESGAESPRSTLSGCSDADGTAGMAGSAVATPALSVAGTDACDFIDDEGGDWADIADIIRQWPVSTREAACNKSGLCLGAPYAASCMRVV